MLAGVYAAKRDWRGFDVQDRRRSGACRKSHYDEQDGGEKREFGDVESLFQRADHNSLQTWDKPGFSPLCSQPLTSGCRMRRLQQSK
jgi:hypothetical protein